MYFVKVSVFFFHLSGEWVNQLFYTEHIIINISLIWNCVHRRKEVPGCNYTQLFPLDDLYPSVKCGRNLSLHLVRSLIIEIFIGNCFLLGMGNKNVIPFIMAWLH